MKTNSQNTPNYYSTYLRKLLVLIGDKRSSDESFIQARSSAASEEFQECRLGGMNPHSAQECAMEVLLQGVSSL